MAVLDMAEAMENAAALKAASASHAGWTELVSLSTLADEHGAVIVRVRSRLP